MPPSLFRIVAFAGAAAGLAACSAKTSGGALHSEKYFETHSDARALTMHNCQADVVTESPMNCEAAEEAKDEVHLRDIQSHEK